MATATRSRAIARTEAARPRPSSSGWRTTTSRSSATASTACDRGASADRLVPVPRSGLGLLRTGAGRPRPRVIVLRGDVRGRAREPALLVVTKANSVSTVHRATYLDYVGVQDLRRPRAASPASGASSACGPRPPTAAARARSRCCGTRCSASSTISASSRSSHDGKALHARARDLSARRAVPGDACRSWCACFRGIVNLYERRRVRLFAASRPLPALLLVPAVRAARPLQHAARERIGADRARGVRRASSIEPRSRCRSRARAPALPGAHAPGRDAASTRRARSAHRADACAPGRTGCGDALAAAAASAAAPRCWTARATPSRPPTRRTDRRAGRRRDPAGAERAGREPARCAAARCTGAGTRPLTVRFKVYRRGRRSRCRTCCR